MSGCASSASKASDSPSRPNFFSIVPMVHATGATERRCSIIASFNLILPLESATGIRPLCFGILTRASPCLTHHDLRVVHVDDTLAGIGSTALT